MLPAMEQRSGESYFELCWDAASSTKSIKLDQSSKKLQTLLHHHPFFLHPFQVELSFAKMLNFGDQREIDLYLH